MGVSCELGNTVEILCQRKSRKVAQEAKLFYCVFTSLLTCEEYQRIKLSEKGEETEIARFQHTELC